LAAASRYCSATVRLFSAAKAFWAWRWGLSEASVSAALASIFVNEIRWLRPEFREGRMGVILGLRCKIR
jgi:hypothetical protein